MDHRTLNVLVNELTAGLRHLGLPADVDGHVARDDVGELHVALDGRTARMKVVSRSDFRPVFAHALPDLADADGGMVFADRISEGSRDLLRARGWGWLDRRRGSLRVWAPGLHIESPIPPTLRSQPRHVTANPFSRTGRTLALWLLTHPDEPASPRALQREIAVSPGQISTLLRALAAEGLVRDDGRPVIPELFWALSERWSTARGRAASIPDLGMAHLEEVMPLARMVASGVRAAVVYGALVAAPSTAPVEIYVPDEQALTSLLHRGAYGSQPSGSPNETQGTDRGPSVVVAVAPTPLVCDERLCHAGDGWPRAHPVVVALDLAASGPDLLLALDRWDLPPSLGVARVW